MNAHISADESLTIPPAAVAALGKFLLLNDDLSATRDLTRRILFELLRTKLTLSTSDIETLWTLEELLADLDRACRA